MSGEAALAVRSWRVGERTVTLTLPSRKPGQMLSAAVEWSPSEPTRLSMEEWREYRAGRSKAIAELAAELGINVAVLDL